MKRERAESLFNLLGEIDEKIIAEADDVERKTAQILPMNRKIGMMRYMKIAASIAFLLVCVWGISGLLGQNFGQFYSESDDMAFVAEDAGDNGDWDEVAMEAEAEDWEGDDDADGDDKNDELAAVDRHLVDFTHQLTEEELRVVFPSLEYEVSAVALFLDDGTLIEVEGAIYLPTGEQLLIRIAEDEIQHEVDLVLESRSRFTISEVEVEVYEYDSVSFMLDNIAYYIDFFEEDVVNQIILGGPADLSVLSEVVIP